MAPVKLQIPNIMRARGDPCGSTASEDGLGSPIPGFNGMFLKKRNRHKRYFRNDPNILRQNRQIRDPLPVYGVMFRLKAE